MSEGRWALPLNWSWVKSAEIAKIVGGGTPQADDERNFTENGIKWITPADLTGYVNVYISGGRRDLSERGLSSSGASLLPKGTVLFSSRAPVGYCAIAANEISTNQGFKSLVLEGDVLPEFVRHYLLSAKDYAESLASGTTFLELSGKRMAELQIPLAPLPEQKRIVNKLDALSVRTTTARAHLNAISKLVEEFRAAILDHVMIQADDKHDWEQSNLEAVRNPEAAIRYGVVQPGAISDKGVQLIRVMDMMGGAIAWDQLRRVAPEIDEAYAKARVENDDVLVSVVGTIGRVALVSGLVERTNIARAVARIRPNKSKVDPKWLSFRLMAADVQARFEGDAREVARKTLNIGLIKETPFKRPPLEKQRAIVRTIEAAFSKVDRLADEAQKTLRLADRLEERILARAFAGELVPQDPNDEPVSALLDRIREARANAPKPKRSRRSEGRTAARAPRKNAAMTKNRQDEDVFQKPYLAELLKNLGEPQEAEALFRQSQLPVADFYKQLAWEVDQGHIKDQQNTLVAI